MSSDQVNRYIDRAGILEQKTTELIRGDEVTRSKGQNKNLFEETILLKEQNAKLQEQLEQLTEKIDGTGSNGGFMSLLRKQAEQQERMAKALTELSGEKFDCVL